MTRTGISRRKRSARRVAQTVHLAAAIALSAVVRAEAQATIPVIDLPAATATSADRFGLIMNVRALPDGRVMIDDAKNRQVKMLNASLATEKIVLDSMLDAANSYGNFPLPLIPYLGDSTLFSSPNKARGVFVIDPNGNVTRALAMPHAGEAALLRRVAADNAGRVIFMAFAPVTHPPTTAGPPTLSDSAPLLRADFAARTTDTIAWVARPMARFDIWQINARRPGELSFWQPDPLKSIDEWAVLTDGSLAMVRGHDYRIDWLRSDGRREASAKLPFDWKPLSDDDKRRLIDTVEAQWRAAGANNTLIATSERSPTPWPRTALSGSEDPAAPSRPSFDTTKAVTTNVLLEGPSHVRLPDKPSVETLFDYYPPIRTGAALADMDNHLWILPTISKSSKQGELVYDVVNTKGELFERVRVPLGRFIVGFAPRGVVYLATGSVKAGFAVERSVVPSTK